MPPLLKTEYPQYVIHHFLYSPAPVSISLSYFFWILITGMFTQKAISHFQYVTCIYVYLFTCINECMLHRWLVADSQSVSQWTAFGINDIISNVVSRYNDIIKLNLIIISITFEMLCSYGPEDGNTMHYKNASRMWWTICWPLNPKTFIAHSLPDVNAPILNYWITLTWTVLYSVAKRINLLVFSLWKWVLFTKESTFNDMTFKSKGPFICSWYPSHP